MLNLENQSTALQQFASKVHKYYEITDCRNIAEMNSINIIYSFTDYLEEAVCSWFC